MHFKLINSLAKAAQDLNMPKEHELSPHRLHSDLFLSGIDRILLVRPSLFSSSKILVTNVVNRLRGKHPRHTTRTCTSRSRGTSPLHRVPATTCRGRLPNTLVRRLQRCASPDTRLPAHQPARACVRARRVTHTRAGHRRRPRCNNHRCKAPGTG